MTQASTQQQIRELAHQLWEADGRPEGRSAEHWAEAERRLAADASPASSRGVPAVEAAIRYRGEANGSTR